MAKRQMYLYLEVLGQIKTTSETKMFQILMKCMKQVTKLWRSFKRALTLANYLHLLSCIHVLKAVLNFPLYNIFQRSHE